MNIDNERKKFDNWVLNEAQKNIDNIYLYPSTLKDCFKAWQASAKQSQDEITSLRAEIESLRKDAERYRWLRSCTSKFHHVCPDSAQAVKLMQEEFLSGDSLDQAIDQAKDNV